MDDQELNEAVALKLGWVNLEWSEPSGLRPELSGKREGSPPFGETVPAYSTSIAAAWEIIQYCENELVLYQIDLSWSRTGSSWHCTLGTKNQYNESVGADTAPLAICKAFLKLP